MKKYRKGCLKFSMFLLFDQGVRPCELKHRSKYNKMHPVTKYNYFQEWKKVGGEKKLQMIETIKQSLKGAILSEGIGEKEKNTIPFIIKSLESKPYEFFIDKSRSEVFEIVSNEVDELPRCLI